MPQIHNLPNRIPESNFREASLLNAGFMQNVMDARKRIKERNRIAETLKNAMQTDPERFKGSSVEVDTYQNTNKNQQMIDAMRPRYKDDNLLQGPSDSSVNVLNPNIDLEPMKVIGQRPKQTFINTQENIMNEPFPTGTAQGVLGNRGANIDDDLKRKLIENGIDNSNKVIGKGLGNSQETQQQILQPQLQETDLGMLGEKALLPTPEPIDVFRDLRRNNGEQSETISKSGNNYQNQNDSLSVFEKMSNKIGFGQGIGAEESYNLDYKEPGLKYNDPMQIVKTTNNRVNVEDHIKKDYSDLLLGSMIDNAVNSGVSPNEGISPVKSLYDQMIVEKAKVLGNRAEQLKGMGTFQEFDSKDRDVNYTGASFGIGRNMGARQSINISNDANHSSKYGGGGGKGSNPYVNQGIDTSGNPYDFGTDEQGNVIRKDGNFPATYSRDSNFSVFHKIGTMALNKLENTLENNYSGRYKLNEKRNEIIDTHNDDKTVLYVLTEKVGDEWGIKFRPIHGVTPESVYNNFNLGYASRTGTASRQRDKDMTTTTERDRTRNYGLDK